MVYSLAELGERLLIFGQVAGLRDGVDDLPAHDAALVDDERASRGQAKRIIEDTVRLGDLAMRPEVRQQAELVTFLVRPGTVGIDGIDRNRQHLDVVPVGFWERVTHLA